MADPGFDNEAYWERRKAGQRGQEFMPSQIVGAVDPRTHERAGSKIRAILRPLQVQSRGRRRRAEIRRLNGGSNAN